MDFLCVLHNSCTIAILTCNISDRQLKYKQEAGIFTQFICVVRNVCTKAFLMYKQSEKKTEVYLIFYMLWTYSQMISHFISLILFFNVK